MSVVVFASWLIKGLYALGLAFLFIILIKRGCFYFLKEGEIAVFYNAALAPIKIENRPGKHRKSIHEGFMVLHRNDSLSFKLSITTREGGVAASFGFDYAILPGWEATCQAFDFLARGRADQERTLSIAASELTSGLGLCQVGLSARWDDLRPKIEDCLTALLRVTAGMIMENMELTLVE